MKRKGGSEHDPCSDHRCTDVSWYSRDHGLCRLKASALTVWMGSAAPVGPFLTIHQKQIFTCFTEDVPPRTISTFRFGTPNSSARKAQIAAFAFPFSGAAVTFTFSDPSGCSPTISFRELLGTTFNARSRTPLDRSSAK